MAKQIDAYIRDRQGRYVAIKGHRVGFNGSIILHRSIKSMRPFDGVEYCKHGWQLTSQRTGARILNLSPHVKFNEARQIANNVHDLAGVLLAKLRMNDAGTEFKDPSVIKAIGDRLMHYRLELMDQGKLY